MLIDLLNPHKISFWPEEFHQTGSTFFHYDKSKNITIIISYSREGIGDKSYHFSHDSDLGKLSKIKTVKHMEFLIFWFTPPPKHMGKQVQKVGYRCVFEKYQKFLCLF